jgi:hypothetical protein
MFWAYRAVKGDYRARLKVRGIKRDDERIENAMPECEQLRTDVVGSLLRPAGLRETRAALEKGEIDTQAMRKAEDEAIAGAVRMQESVGLDVLTDGEYRRLNFQDSFGLAVEGYDAVASDLSASVGTFRRWGIRVPQSLTDVPSSKNCDLRAIFPWMNIAFSLALRKSRARSR